MKKLLGILVLGLLWCNVGSATPDASLTIIVDPSDASCILKKKNKIEKIKSGQKFYVPGFVVPFKTVIYIICKKDGYKTVIDRLKYSKTSPNVGNAAVDAAFDNPVGVVVELLSLNFGTAYLRTDGSPGHGITLLPGEGTLLYRKGKIIKPSDLSKKELKLLKNFLDGKWIDDKSDGQATHTYGTEEEYVGDRINGKKHGQGILTYANGEKYVGEFKEDKRNGQGTYTWPDGDKYVGEYKNDKIHGQGTYTWPDGEKYVGEFKDNKKHGQATHTYSTGEEYVGEYKNGKMHGQGTFTGADGDKYVGEYKNDKMHGQGTFTGADGEKYVGEFKDSSKHGQGTRTWPDGGKYVGEFKDNEEDGQGTFTGADGIKYVGEYKDGKVHGRGTQTWPDGIKYVGEFKDGSMHGQGTFVWPVGDKYVGEFKDNSRDGQGTYTYADGTFLKGIWKDGQLAKDTKPWLGIEFNQPEIDGVRVVSLFSSGPADIADIEKGDIIISYNSKAVKKMKDFLYLLSQSKAGDSVNLKILRDGKEIIKTVKLGAR